MRVLHVTSGNLFGGIETMLLTIARNRDAAAGVQSHFAVCFHGRLKSELEANGADVHDLGEVRARNPLSVRRARRVLRSTIEREGIDVVVCHASWPQAIFGPVATVSGRPLVLWQHGAADDGVAWLERWARMSRPDLVICNSEYTATSVRSATKSGRVEVVHCPVEPPAVADDAAGRRAILRAEFQTSPDDVAIVLASRLEPWKGHRQLLEALARLTSLDGWIAWIAGGVQRPSEEPYRRELERAAESAGIVDRVRFLGQRADVPDILAAADVHCQPNVSPEPFGISFVEALYAGLPVVSTAFGGVLEIVDETCGRLTRPGDVDGLAQQLEALIRNPELRRSLGKAGPARAASLCDPDRQVALIGRTLSTLQSAVRATA